MYLNYYQNANKLITETPKMRPNASMGVKGLSNTYPGHTSNDARLQLEEWCIFSSHYHPSELIPETN